MTQPHPYFEAMRPDEVAECVDGIMAHQSLYNSLWECVQYYEPRTDYPEEPIYGENSLDKFWHMFTDEEHLALNEAVTQHVIGD